MSEPKLFNICFSAHRDSTNDFHLLQCSSRVLIIPRSPDDTPGISRLFLLNPHLCIIVDLIFDLFGARNDLSMS